MSRLYSSIISILLGFVIVSLILQIAGLYPIDFFAALIRTISGYDIHKGTFVPRYIGDFFVTVVPILLTGISVSFAFKTGLFNIGAEGQFMAGGAFAVFLGLNLNLPPVIFPIVVLIGAGAMGALWGFVPGILKATKNIHEVVICIMMNYIALYASNLYMNSVEGFSNSKTPKLNENALLKSEFLESLIPSSKLNWGILVAVVALITYFVIINKSTLGYKLKVIGFNKDAAKYSGINVKAGMVQSMAISGAFSGVAGAIVVLGTFYFGRHIGGFENYGFDGLSVALVSGGSAIGIFLSALLFSALSGATPIMQIYKIPVEISTLVSGLIVFFISLSLVTDDKLERRRLKKLYKSEKKEDE